MGNVVRLATQNRGEVKVAECENGYTRIANELFDALLAADLTKHQYKVALAVIRKTYGFNQSHDRISNSQLAELTGLPQTRVSTAKNQLLAMGVLAMRNRRIGPNKVLSEWTAILPRNGEGFPETGKNDPPVSVMAFFPETGKEFFPKTGKEVSPKQGNTKDTIQKTRKTKDHNTCAEPAFADSTPVVIDPDPAVPVAHPLTPIQPVPPPEPPEPVVITMPLNSGAEHPVTESFAATMQTLYPAVDVAQELRTMCGWLIANPTKRKTKSGIARFINAWLAKCQNQGGQNGMQGYRPRGSDHTDLTKTMTAEELNRRILEGF